MKKTSASIKRQQPIIGHKMGKQERTSILQVGVAISALTLLILAASSGPVAANSKGQQLAASTTTSSPATSGRTLKATQTGKGELGQSKRSSGGSNLATPASVWGHKLGDDSSAQGGSKFGDSSALESNIANAQVQVSPNDMSAAAGHHHSHGGGHGKYYMYAESPKKGAYKMGFKRGNHKHMIERKESAHKSHVHSYFKWHDKKGKGSHKFEFKHSDYKKKKHHY